MKICAQTLVKNEDRFLWFAAKSVIDHVDRLMLWDTGSSDQTLVICELLAKQYPHKIEFEKHQVQNPNDVTLLRQQMLDRTKEDWALILDGDEVWWRDSIKVLVSKIQTDGDTLDSIVNPYVNLVGDIYHYQPNNLGKYKIDGRVGFLTIRAFRTTIPGLHVKNTYPLEGYYDKNNVLLQELDPKRRIYMDYPFLHFTHLSRSSKVKNKKNKFETGKSLPLDYFYPEVFFEDHPDIVSDVWRKQSTSEKYKSSVNSFIKLPKRIYAKSMGD